MVKKKKKRRLIKTHPEKPSSSPLSLANVTLDKRGIIIDLSKLSCQFKRDGAA